MDNILLSPVPIEQLKSELSATVKKELLAFLAEIQLPKEQPDILTRKQAAQLLGISLPTLNEWTKEGKVIGYRISSRVRYKKSELETSLTQIKTPKAQRRA